MNKTISWFEIPVSDMVRAQKFYQTVVGTDFKSFQFGTEEHRVFAYDRENGATGGALVPRRGGEQHGTGPIVYVTLKDSVSEGLARVPAAGGQVVTPRTELPNGAGAFAVILDSEGNRVGLHAMK